MIDVVNLHMLYIVVEGIRQRTVYLLCLLPLFLLQMTDVCRDESEIEPIV